MNVAGVEDGTRHVAHAQYLHDLRRAPPCGHYDHGDPRLHVFTAARIVLKFRRTVGTLSAAKTIYLGV
jgi:hypothetical protein